MNPRHLARSIAMQSLYEWDFNEKKKDLKLIVEENINNLAAGLEEEDFLFEIILGVKKNIEEIDEIIKKFTPHWSLDRISGVDRNILRIGVYELFFGDKEKVSHKIAINEAVELAKRFGGESSSRFVNGVLGTAFRKLIEEKDKPAKKEKKEEAKKDE
jgi:N utilization substance protein B